MAEPKKLQLHSTLTPSIGENGNWYVGDRDTGKPSMPVVKAEISRDNNAVVEFKNASGVTLFVADLSTLWIRPGAEVVSNGLIFNGDTTKFTTDTLTMDDETGNVSMTTYKDVIQDLGLLSQGAGKRSVVATWKEPPSFGEGMAVEFFAIGGHPYRTHEMLMHVGTLSGRDAPTCSIATSANYIKTDGTSSSFYVEPSRWLDVYDDDGNMFRYNTTSVKGSQADRHVHFVLNLYPDGRTDLYANGYRCSDPSNTVTDFVKWDFSAYETKFQLWSGAYNYSKYLRSFRIYNRCLSKEAIRNNLNYEINRLGSVHRINLSLTNVTTPNGTINFVKADGSYEKTIAPKDGYEISTVTVTMGGVDITSEVYADGVISIPSVTADVFISAAAVATA